MSATAVVSPAPMPPVDASDFAMYPGRTLQEVGITDVDPRPACDRSYTGRYTLYFDAIGSSVFATEMAKLPAFDPRHAARVVQMLPESEVLAACSFHGNIGEKPVSLDAHGRAEQGSAFTNAEELREVLLREGEEYCRKHGIKFMVSAAGLTGLEMLNILRRRVNNAREEEWQTARNTLLEIGLKRLAKDPYFIETNFLQRAAEHYKTSAAAVALQIGGGDDGDQKIQTMSLGECTDDNVYFEMASLSKMVGACFAIEYFARHGIDLETPVNEFLATIGDSYRVPVAEGLPEHWADKLTLEHIMSHNGLNMHYVHGIPIHQEGYEKFVPIESYLFGFGYNTDRVEIIFEPGTSFKYSGAGFILLQYLIERHSKRPIEEAIRPFLDKIGAHDLTFDVTQEVPGKTYVMGRTDAGARVRKLFPPFAAGAFGSVRAMQTFQYALAEAYRRSEGFRGISHDTARRMLHGRDRDFDFMGCKVGTGVFVLEGNENLFMLHQGANDGYRVLNMHCFSGPDFGKGFVTVSTGDIDGVAHNAAVAQAVIDLLEIAFVDKDKFKATETLQVRGLRQEEIVNKGYKSLVMAAFTPTRAVEITDKGPLDELADYNLMTRGVVVGKTNDRFARAENMLSRYHPKFDPQLFSKMGKVMDSWESERHNPRPFDAVVVQVPPESRCRFVYLSTKYHNGNQPPHVSVEVADENVGLTPELEPLAFRRLDENKKWQTLVPKMAMDAHSYVKFDLGELSRTFNFVRVRMYPDGGFTHIGLYGDELPAEFRRDFLPLNADPKAVVPIRHPDEIPQMTKPLSMPYDPTAADIEENISKLSAGQVFDIASAAVGGSVVFASNQHYGAASNTISPFPPLSLFDALESSRSRTPGTSVEMVARLAWATPLKFIEIEFTWLINNSPVHMSIEAHVATDRHGRGATAIAENKITAKEAVPAGEWVTLVPKRYIKHYAGGVWREPLKTEHQGVVFDHIRVRCFPCGGFNRMRVFAEFDPKLRQQ
jgi:allantoicase